MRWFEIALVVLTLFTGLVWLLDKLVLAKRREARQGCWTMARNPSSSTIRRRSSRCWRWC